MPRRALLRFIHQKENIITTDGGFILRIKRSHTANRSAFGEPFEFKRIIIAP